MKYKKLGVTGYDVSLVGFGTWQIAGERWNITNETDQIKLLRSANDLGVNIFDAAMVYGSYKGPTGREQIRSLELLGEAFSDRRQKVIYNIKLGQIDEYSHRHDYSPARLIHHFKEALRILDTDYLDIALVHAPNLADVKSEKAIRVLQTLRELGLIKCLGYSFENEPKHTMEAIQQQVDVIMLQYNLLDNQCKKVIDIAEEHGVGVIVGGPYKRGYLTGKYSTAADLPTEDGYWRWNLDYNPLKVKELLTRVSQEKKKFSTLLEFRKHCLKHIIEKSGVASCIIGHRKLSEVQENIQLIAEILAEIESTEKNSGLIKKEKKIATVK